MSSPDLLSEGLTLMGFGMGFVFLFLALLIGMTSLMSRLVIKYAPEPTSVKKASPAPQTAPAIDQTQLVAVISAAVHKFRASR
jgi:oxaloacetate decarboxylase gamma subunit